MAKVKLTQIKSKSGATKRQIANLTSLGIRKMHQSVVVELTPVTKGMIERVAHLVTCEPVNE
jgi:large subunit ribosomal protein L30